jgi:hypothetical protein
MRRVKLLRDWLLLLSLACAAAAPVRAAPPPTAPPALQPLAHSSLLTLEGANTPAGLLLRVRPNSGTTPLTVSEFSVVLDGKSIPAAARTDGTWLVSLPAPAATGQLDVTVTHDGIRELLSATLPSAQSGAAPAAPAAVTGATGVHKQIVWWILNVLIVLVAAIAISRRTS